MKPFFIRELKNCNNVQELESIGFDSSYRFRAVEKMNLKLLKVYSLSPAQANILKQTAISIGADCLTHREVITGGIDSSNAIITANIAELKKLAQKLVFQPLGLKALAEEILEVLASKKEKKTRIVGILNLTENSFSDGGMYLKFDDAIKHLNQLIDDGADGIDIGAESTKPGAYPVDSSTQLQRILPVIDYILSKGISLPISIDTRCHEVADEVLKRGDFIINDVSGLEYDKQMLPTIAKYNAKLVIQHSKGLPLNMQKNPSYVDVMEEVYSFLDSKINYAKDLGVENIIIDPGIGFGKTKEHNREILDRIEELYLLRCPVMVGVSRKSLLGIMSDDNTLKDSMTLAYNSRLVEKGVDFLRVHNVKLHNEFLKNL